MKALTLLYWRIVVQPALKSCTLEQNHQHDLLPRALSWELRDNGLSCSPKQRIINAVQYQGWNKGNEQKKQGSASLLIFNVLNKPAKPN